MPESIDIKTLLKKNPNLSIEDIAKGVKLTSKLRRHGVERPRYRLVPASEGRRIRVGERELDDSSHAITNVTDGP